MGFVLVHLLGHNASWSVLSNSSLTEKRYIHAGKNYRANNPFLAKPNDNQKDNQQKDIIAIINQCTFFCTHTSKHALITAPQRSWASDICI